MKKNIIFLLFLILFVGCTKDRDGEEIIYRKGIIYTVSSQEPYTGYGYSNYDKDHVESEGYSQNGIPNGQWKYYYYNGTLHKIGNFKNGKLDGKWKYYHHNGELKGTVLYENGKEIKE